MSQLQPGVEPPGGPPRWRRAGTAHLVAVPSAREVPEVESHPPSRLTRLKLLERLGPRTWLGRTGDGTVVVARRIPLPPDRLRHDDLALAERARGLADLQLPSLVPVLAAAQKDGAIWLISEVDKGVSLHRLLERARLSPMQATALAAGVLDAVSALHDAGHAHASLSADKVRVGARGEVRLADWGRAALVPPEEQGQRLRRADREATAAIVTEIAGATGGGGEQDGPRADLLALLERAGTPRKLSATGLDKMAAKLEAALGGPEELARARDGVGGLVAAISGDEGDEKDEAPPEAPVPLPELPGRSRLSRALGAVWSRIWRVAALVLVLGALVAIELLFFGDEVSRNVDVIRGRQPAAGQEVAGAGEREPAPVPALAPSAAGPITGIELRPLDDPCRAGEVCEVLVHVLLQPQGAPLRVAWHLEVVDRCGGRQVSRPGAVAWALPGHDRVVEVGSVALPPGRSLAVIPVTSEPVSVAGQPMSTDGDGSC